MCSSDLKTKFSSLRYLFLCDCGNHFTYRIKEVINGKIKNCGYCEYVNKTFNYLLFLGNKYIDGKTKSLFKCKCGNECKFELPSVISNRHKSCGCIRNLVKENERYGLLTTIKECGKDNAKHKKWLCKCDCGNEKIVTGYHLKGGTKSCGCLREQNRRNSKNWKGYGEIPNTYWKSIIRGAKERNIEFNLTIEYIWKLFLKQNRKCKLSHIDLFFGVLRKGFTASLDRIDSDKGYVEGNVQWIHKDVNRMKLNLKQDYFIEICKKIGNIN